MKHGENLDYNNNRFYLSPATVLQSQSLETAVIVLTYLLVRIFLGTALTRFLFLGTQEPLLLAILFGRQPVLELSKVVNCWVWLSEMLRLLGLTVLLRLGIWGRGYSLDIDPASGRSDL